MVHRLLGAHVEVDFRVLLGHPRVRSGVSSTRQQALPLPANIRGDR